MLFFILIGTTTVFAEEGGLIVTKSDQGEDVYYTVSMAQGSNINAGDLEITYKDKNLEYVDWVQADSALANNGLLACNPDTANKRILVSYATLQDTSAGGDIATFHFKKLENEDSSSTPVLGITVKGLYANGDDEDNTVAIIPQISGDKSVAVVTEGKTIEDAGDTAIALSEDQSVAAEVQSAENDTEEATQNDEEEAQTSNNQWMPMAVVIILVVLGMILIFVQRKKHRKKSDQDSNEKIKKSKRQKPNKKDKTIEKNNLDQPDQETNDLSSEEKIEADVSTLFEDSKDDKK